MISKEKLAFRRKIKKLSSELEKHLDEMPLTYDRSIKYFLGLPNVCTEFLRTCTGRPDLEIVKFNLPRKLSCGEARSVIVDFLCRDSAGRYIVVEMQKSNTAPHLLRARRTIGSIDVTSLKKNEKLENLPRVCLIYITEFDFIKGGKAVYHVERTFAETGQSADNGTEEIYINTVYDDQSLIAGLMKVLTSGKPDNRFPEISNTINNLKSTEEGRKLMKSFFETQEEICYNDGMAVGMEKGMEKGIKEGIEKGMEKGQITAWCASAKKIMLNLKMTLEDALDFLEIPINFRPAIIKSFG